MITSDMIDADERLLPTIANKHTSHYKEHLQRYVFANKYILNPKSKILDIACGVGYGTRYIASNNEYASIHGVDISIDCIKYAMANYDRENIVYQNSDATDLKMFDDNVFDYALSFETIEHVPIGAEYTMLKELYRVMRKDGILILSTPNRVRDNYQANKFHFKEYTVVELIELLTSCGFVINGKYCQLIYKHRYIMDDKRSVIPYDISKDSQVQNIVLVCKSI